MNSAELHSSGLPPLLSMLPLLTSEHASEPAGDVPSLLLLLLPPGILTNSADASAAGIPPFSVTSRPSAALMHCGAYDVLVLGSSGSAVALL
jgi:hypothetical protein